MRSGDSFLRLGVLAFAMCLGAGPARAQEIVERQPEASEPSNPSGEAKSYNLSGTVLNSVTGEPIRRAAVEISGQIGNIALTDTGGRFVLEGLAEGNVFLNAQKPGFYDGEASHTLPVRVGKDAPSVVLKLTPSVSITGRITTKDERPLEGFQVRVVGKMNVEGHLVWVDQMNQARTNDEGEYRIVGLRAGTYYVAIDQGGGMSIGERGVPNGREQTYARVFYPGVSDMNAAAPVDLAPGREIEANFTLMPESVYQVSGSVAGSADFIAGLRFERKTGDDVDFNGVGTVQDGRFEAKLPAGAYSVTAETRDGVVLSTAGASVVIRADEAELPIALNAAAMIRVEIKKEQGGEGSETGVRQPMDVAGVFLQPISGRMLRGGMNWWRAQAGGIPNVAPGVYSLKVNTVGDWWVKSAQSGSVDLLSDDLTVVDGAQTAPIEITLRDDGAQVSGTVSPADDSSQITVLLVQPRGKKNFIKIVQGAMQGNFLIQGVPPGDYSLLALDGGDTIEYANPEALSPYLSEAEHVSLRPHGQVSVHLTVTPVKR